VPELKHVYCKHTVFRQAWAAARHDAQVYGGQPRHYLPTTLRQAWERTTATREMRARVLAQIERFRQDQQPLAKARHARKHAAFMAELDAQMARVAELDRDFAAKYLQPAQEDAA
jgi:hypothetical protein